MAEIAGLVLGAIPLVISAYEHRKTLLDSAEAFFHGKKDYDKIVRRLHIEYASYDQNMRLLLIRAVNEEELEQMIKNSQHSLWKSEALTRMLTKELGSAYEPTMGLLEDLGKTLSGIVAKLGISGSDKVKQLGLAIIISSNPPISNSQDPQERFRFEKRLEFTLKRRSVDKKLQAITKFNTDLRNLLQGAYKINQFQKDEGLCHKARIQFVAPLQSIQQNASRLHRGLHKRWCGTHDCHRAGLLLEQRLHRKRIHRQGLLKDGGNLERFGVALPRVEEKTWLDMEIRVLGESIPETSFRSSPKIPKIRFAMPGPSFPPAPPALEIDDICSAIAGAMHPQTGLDLDSSDVMRGLYGVDTQQRHLAQDLITLDKFLATNTMRLGMGDMLCLAVTLVSSVIQLGKTPWLVEPWSRHNIVFLRLKGDGNSQIDAKHPYLVYKYETGPPPQNSDSSMILCSRQSMLSLGVMLLEIHCGTPLEDMTKQTDLGRDGLPNEETSYTTASRVLEERINDGQVSFGFKTAIEYCLHFSRQPDASFENAEFVRSIEEQVLEPLERETQRFLFG
ncbi:hypothetical protein CABS03_06260 [Colletotrichum abscissum]|uniref:DUF7580 domain-containing protein n=1 Tax=Colletotrichum abscissum TaxID=1671311 RepID=A0A9Q0AWU4_9PEZI|nr:hypothetical protein CABS02_14506 [Colletotrichum abscissum]